MKKITLDKRKIDYDSLNAFGFINEKYQKDIMNGDFKIVIEIKDNEVISYVIDNQFDEEYTNVDLNTIGEFVGTIKDNYEEVINSFINKCTEYDINYHDQVNEVIKYINDKYNDEIEYLWDSSPDSGIFRNKKNRKWYATILSVREDRVGGTTDKIITVIDLSYYKDKTKDIIDNSKIYPGYHMNKKSWITIKLDGSVDNEFIYKYIDISYEISINK